MGPTQLFIHYPTYSFFTWRLRLTTWKCEDNASTTMESTHILFLRVFGDHGETLVCRHQVEHQPIRRVTLRNRALWVLAVRVYVRLNDRQEQNAPLIGGNVASYQSLKWNERQLLLITLTSPILFLFIENILWIAQNAAIMFILKDHALTDKKILICLGCDR